MKKLITLLSLITLPLYSSTKEEIFEAIFDAIETATEIDQTRGDCNFSTQIIQLPFTINTPGFYCLGTDLAAPTNNSGINITTDNVSLDLNGKTISGGAPAISFSNRQNIFIGNGTVRDVVGNGIQIGGASVTVVLEQISLFNCINGMNIAGVSNLFINNCGAFLSRGAGFIISTCRNGSIKNCVANSNGQASGGIAISNSANLIISNCMANANTSQGFLQQRSRNCTYKNCTANSNINNGFALLNDSAVAASNSNNVLKNCTAEQNGNNGFVIRGNENNVQNCAAQSNSLNGFWLSGIGHTVSDSLAQGNNLNGFLINGNGASLLTSVAKANGATGFLLAAAVNGLPVSSNAQIRGNTAQGNATGFQNAGTSATVTPGGNRVYSNFANANGTNYIGIANVVTSPAPADAINFTANISE
jgi:parallel beta-helix repeat protein